MLEIDDLLKQYSGPDGRKVTALDLQTLRLEPAEQVALVGPSGSGKTTLLHAIAGLLTPSRGEIRLNGQRLGELSGQRRDIWRARNVGYVFQNLNLLPNLNALENVWAALAFAGMIPKSETRQRAEALLKAVDLEDRMFHRPSQLSLGEQQRVAVARALANRPALVLADEPTASLDQNSSQMVLEMIRRLCREQESMLILATHDPSVMEKFSRRIELRRVREVAPDVHANSVA